MALAAVRGGYHERRGRKRVDSNDATRGKYSGLLDDALTKRRGKLAQHLQASLIAILPWGIWRILFADRDATKARCLHSRISARNAREVIPIVGSATPFEESIYELCRIARA